MKRTMGRILAATVSAAALVGMGMSGAFAADTVTDPNWQGTPFIADAETAEPVTGTIGFEQVVVGILDLSDYEIKYPIPAEATGGWVFVSQRGSESDPKKWAAKSAQVLTPGGLMLPNFTLNYQGTPGTSTGPNGINAVKAAGGEYSIGIAFTKDNGINLIPDSSYFGHITVTPGTGSWTYTDTVKDTTPTTTTTTLTVPATAPAENTAFSLSATVAPAAATGTVEFFDGTTSLGTATLVAGSATLDVAAGLPGGAHPITATYLGVTGYATSTSAASTITIAGTPIPTTLVVTASSATGAPNQAVVLGATVTPAAAQGSVAFSAVKAGSTTPVNLGDAPVSGGVATLTVNSLGLGDWTVSGAFTGAAGTLYGTSTDAADAAVSLASDAPEATPDDQTVKVVIDDGELTITTPYTPAAPLDLGTLVLNQTNSTFETAAVKEFGSRTDIAKAIKIENSRPDFPTFTASVQSTDFVSANGDTFDAEYAGLVNLASVQVTGNALLAADVDPTDVPVLTGSPQVFATYAPAAPKLGTAWVAGDMLIKGVPSSTPAGAYTATLTFTAF